MKILFAVLLPFLAALPLYAAETPVSARLGEINGGVWARASKSASWVEVKDGTMLAPGGEVRTARGASAVLAFSDNNKVRLNSATVFGLEGATTVKTSLRLFSGRIQAWVKRANKADFTVRHAAGVAAVRGTILEAEGTDSGLSVTLFEGAVDVVDAFGKASTLGPRQIANLSPTSGLQGITSLPPGTKTPEEPKVNAPPPPAPSATQTEQAPPPETIAAETTTVPPTTSPVQESANTTTSIIESATISPSAPPP